MTRDHTRHGRPHHHQLGADQRAAAVPAHGRAPRAAAADVGGDRLQRQRVRVAGGGDQGEWRGCTVTSPDQTVAKGVRDVINVDELFECRPAINAAFHHCKSISKVNLNILMLIICSTVVKF